MQTSFSIHRLWLIIFAIVLFPLLCLPIKTLYRLRSILIETIGPTYFISNVCIFLRFLFFAKIQIKKKLAKFIFILIMKMIVVEGEEMRVLEIVMVEILVVMGTEMINKGEMVGLALVLLVKVRRGRRR